MMARGSGARILILSSKDPGMAAAKHILEAAGHSVTELRGANETFGWLRIHRAEIMVIDLPADEQSEAAYAELLAVVRQTAGTDVLALVRARGGRGPQMRSLFLNHHLTHFLAIGGDGKIDPLALTVTVSKILT